MLVTPDGIEIRIPELYRGISENELQKQLAELNQARKLVLNDCEVVSGRIKDYQDRLEKLNEELATARARRDKDAPTKEAVAAARQDYLEKRAACDKSFTKSRKEARDLAYSVFLTLKEQREQREREAADAAETIDGVKRAMDVIAPWIDEFISVEQTLRRAISIRKLMLERLSGGDREAAEAEIARLSGVNLDQGPNDYRRVRQDGVGVTSVYVGNDASHSHVIINGGGQIIYRRPRSSARGAGNLTRIGWAATM